MKVLRLTFIIVLCLANTGCWYLMLAVSPVDMCEYLDRELADIRPFESPWTYTNPRTPSPKPKRVKPTGHVLYTAGLRCFEEFDYTAALGHFAGAIAADGLSQKDRAACHFYRGAIFVILGKKDNAVEEFRKCKSICPNYAPSREIFRPDVIALYESCAKK